MVNATTVVGTNIGVSDNNCWGYNNSQAYRADVTSLVQATGNGLYNLSGFGALNPNGASLIVFFNDGNGANNRDVVIFDGNDSNVSFPGISANPNAPADPAGWNVTLSGINYTSGTSFIELHVSDGQIFNDDAVKINNTTFIPTGPIFSGNTVPGANNGPANNGRLWDIQSFNVTAFLNPGPNVLNLTTGLGADCLGLIVALINLPAGAAPPNVFYSKSSGDLSLVTTWGSNPDGSGTNPPDFGLGKTFNLANRNGTYTLTNDWTIGGLLVNQTGNQLYINGYNLSIAEFEGGGQYGGTRTSNLTVTYGQKQGDFTVYPPLNFVPGFNNLNNLTSNAHDLPIFAPLNVFGTLTVGSGTLYPITNNSLTLKSTSTSTARVAPVTGNISGPVTVERYIPARRAWRIMGAPVAGSQSINSAWQEGATTSSVNPNPKPGFGTHITEGSPADGFDHNPLTAMASIKRYVSATDTWTPLANTNATAVNADAYFLFVRGDRGIALGANTVPPTPTTLRATGPLKTGNQTFPVNATGFTAIPNPFASPINFATITRNNVQNNFYVWDPKLGGPNGVGAYVLLSFNGSSYDATPAPISPESQFIQSGQGFLVHTTSTASAGSLVIKESDKSTTTPSTDVFRMAAPAASTGLRINLQSLNADNTTSLLDEVFSSYGSTFSDKVDELDGFKMANVEENLAITRDGHNLMIERSKALDKEDVIQLKLWNTAAGKQYLLEFNPLNLPGNVSTAYLVDHYLHTTTTIGLDKTTQLSFSVNSDAASSNADRFTVAFTPVSAAAAINGKAGIVNYPNPVSGKTIQLFFSQQPQGSYKVELVNGMGQVVQRNSINHAGGSAIQHIEMNNKPAAGIYLLNITNAQTKTTLKVVVR